MFRILSLLAILAAAFSGPAFADTAMAKACSTLDRPNIDCSCVAKRIDIMKSATTSQTGKSSLEQGYLWELNLPNSYIETSKTLNRSADFLNFHQAMDVFGGVPDEIADYEEGCVIPQAPKPTIPVAEPGSVTEGLTKLCASQGDEGKARFCACYADRKRQSVTSKELEAHYRGYADWLGKDIKTAGQKDKTHAEIMGISQQTYEALILSANKKIENAASADNNHCEALTWADKKKGSSATIRNNGGLSADILARLKNNTNVDTKKSKTLGQIAQAEDIITAACKSQGKTDSQCTCMVKDFRANVVPKATKASHAFGWAVLQFGNDGMNQSDFLAALQSMSQEDQMAAGQLLGTTPEIGQNCRKQNVSAKEDKKKGLSGDATQRMMKICESDGTPKAMCECTTNSMKSSLGADDFELIVDIREAEHLGYDDPMKKVAEDRGLTKAEAEQAMAMNQQLMSGMMNMNLMSCLGDMSKFMPQ